MKTKDMILKIARQKGGLTSADVVKLAGISRQAAAKHLRELVWQKQLSKEGSTHNARYMPFSASQIREAEPRLHFKKTFHTQGLEEHQVFEEVVLRLHLKRELSKDAFAIANFTFTEMLNNAIEHSKASRVTVETEIKFGQFDFRIEDHGVGAFESIRKKFKLKNDFEAAEHLLKGKQTTDPKHHSGQGIFFTSRAADRFILESSGLRLRFDNEIHDVFLEDMRLLPGTRVWFQIKQKSRKNLKEIFDQFSNEEFEFDKTEIKIHLSKAGTGWVSRSEARRILFGLEKFKRIVLDFNGISSVGQGFADEVFRVFQKAHPSIRVEAVNMIPVVEFMIQRARK